MDWSVALAIFRNPKLCRSATFIYTYRIFFSDSNLKMQRFSVPEKPLRRILQSNYSVKVNSTETNAVLLSDFIVLYRGLYGTAYNTPFTVFVHTIIIIGFITDRLFEFSCRLGTLPPQRSIHDYDVPENGNIE